MAMKPRPRRSRSNPQRGWSAPRPLPATDPRHRRPRTSGLTPPIGPRSRSKPGPDSCPAQEASVTSLEAILDDFTRSWERGESPRAEDYLELLAPEDSSELIYHEFCLAEASDLAPKPDDYLARFPEQAFSLGRLFSIHGAFSSSMLREWLRPVDLPSSGDDIGPYRLLRELGRGAFARVFLAEQADLDHRLVVLKVSTRSTAEPQLLARARHPHIVEVLRHAVAEDGALHLVCMPFLGGATLAAVLEERRSRGRRARSGRDLLSDLDRVSAPEYPSTELARPAREILAGLSHAQALAWVVARLAEALDHAHRRGVAHGDLKPSNVLLTAEANPLLLDFNLSVDWRDAAPEVDAELGGTLAYMAPERLDAIAGKGSEWNRTTADLQRADLYSLGLVLLEALTGRIPEVPRRRTGSPRELAGDLAGLRRTLPGSLGLGGDRSIPPALRSILSRCLASDPLDRYARGKELAEDLDRWRSDRPLAFAEEPRSSGLTRNVRRRRAPLIALGLTMSSAVFVTWLASLVIQGTRRDQALARYSTIIDRADSGAFSFHQSLWESHGWSESIELASRRLSRYGVLNDPDWRTRDEIRELPPREKDELEAWLFEQILRYATALGETPESPESWSRGLTLLDRTLQKIHSEPLQAQRRVLLERLNRPDRSLRESGLPRLPRWMDTYLAGVAAESLQAREAMGLYLEALKERPDLFWGHYRTAVVACRINENDEAARHLRICTARSPGNAALHAQLASILFRASKDMPWWFRHDPFGEALQECDRAQRIDPDLPEVYRTRAMILQVIGQSESVEADLNRFAALSRSAGLSPMLGLRLKLIGLANPQWYGMTEAARSVARLSLEVNPDDPAARTKLAIGLARESRTLEAIGEYDQILEVNPDRLDTRFRRAFQLIKLDRPAAIEELQKLINHPRFEELFTDLPTSLVAFHYVANDLRSRGKIPEALEIAHRSLTHARRSSSLADEVRSARDRFQKQETFAPEGQTIYLLAQIHATAAKAPGITPDEAREHLAKVLDYLKQSFLIHRDFRTVYFDKDRIFDEFRAEICRQLRIEPTPP